MKNEWSSTPKNQRKIVEKLTQVVSYYLSGIQIGENFEDMLPNRAPPRGTRTRGWNKIVIS